MLNSLIHTVVVTIFLLGSSIAFAGLDRHIKVVIEEPAVGESYSGVTNLRGWVVSPAGVGRNALEVYIDGEFAFYMPVGGNRADVAETYPNYPDSDQSGFSMAFNYKSLSPGAHEITVLAFDNVGNYNDAVVSFDTERFKSEFIADGSQVDLSTTEEVYLVDNHSYLMTGVTVEGRQWDFMLSWDKASQSFKTEQIRASGDQSYTAGGTSASSDQDNCEGRTGFGAYYGCASGNGGSSSGGSSNSGSGDSNLTPSNRQVYACLTYRREESPNISTTVMENGLELVYRRFSLGYGWQIVFKSLAGDWYMIVDEAELISIDVLREPDTCREYTYGKVVNVIYDYEGGTLLEFSNYESAIVEAACPIGLGAKLASYQEKTSGTGWELVSKKSFIVDLLTVDVCEVKAWLSS